MTSVFLHIEDLLIGIQSSLINRNNLYVFSHMEKVYLIFPSLISSFMNRSIKYVEKFNSDLGQMDDIFIKQNCLTVKILDTIMKVSYMYLSHRCVSLYSEKCRISIIQYNYWGLKLILGNLTTCLNYIEFHNILSNIFLLF